MERMLNWTFFLLALMASCSAWGQGFFSDEPLAHTYSVVALDPETGDMGVAVQSHWFSVGTVVSWGEAGVGVVATQAFANKSFGPEGLKLLKEGKTPAEAIEMLLKDDEGKEFRQLAILDAKGRVAVHTGSKCIPEAGDRKGEGFSVQANMMKNPTVWPAMARAMEENAELPFPERLLATLQAAESAGGDIREKQSAALLIVKGKNTAEPWNEVVLDIRVDDHPEPLKEMERLIKTFRAYDHMNAGDLAVEKGDMKKAEEEYMAAEKMFPDNLEMQYWHAITLANNQQINEASQMLQVIYRQNADWRELTSRLPAVGLLNVRDHELKKLLE